MLSILTTLATAASYVPKLIKIGADVAPLIAGIRSSMTEIGKVDPQIKSSEQFQMLDQIVIGFEADFKDAVAEHLRRVGE